MRLFQTAFWILVSSASAFSGDFPGPKEPTVDEVRIPEVRMEDPGAALPSLLSVRTAISVSGGQALSGFLVLSNPVLFHHTNREGGNISIRSWTVHQLASVEVLRWKPSRQDSVLFLFEPDLYRVTPEGGEAFLHEGRIPALDRMVVDGGERKTAAFTIFYDRWVEGKKGVYRWEVSRGADFSYHGKEPVTGTAVRIRLNDAAEGN